MVPPLFLLLLIALTFLAMGLSAMGKSRRRKIVREVAARSNMRYAARDPFNLAPRAAARFPIPGVAILCINDVVYSQDGDRFRYVFTAEFTQGVLHHQRRVRRAAAFSESPDNINRESPRVKLADPNLPLAKQYEELIEKSEIGNVKSNESAESE